MPDPVTPFVVVPGDGTPIEVPLGGSNIMKAHTRNTNRSLMVLDCVIPEVGPALHIHVREDEMCYNLEGDLG